MQDLLMLLADGSFHSGSDLGRQLGVSRAAVWKRIQRITQELGISVQSVQGKGYRLAQPLQLLNGDVIRRVFPALPVYMYESLGSTNEQAKQLLSEHSAPMAVLAEHQTQGKGRRGREWVSPFAQNLYLSYVWPITEGLNQIDGLSLVVGLAVSKAIQRLSGIAALLKWPNDVLIDGRKVAGILLELIGDPVELCHVVIGIGVNLNMLDLVDSIDQEWTSLSKEMGAIIDRTLFAQVLIEELDRYLEKQKTYGFASMKAEWLTQHAWQGRNAVLQIGSHSVSGKVVGVADKGELCLLVEGEERKYLGGELSLRLQDDS
ncbi:MAG: bifunctional biotin--[acetyl-CoA-carboxylase] ligase/biotin operon repressor BirA [Gammaproteobacteria bacterium]|jgi:BirA family biotin operon repressor/biotin-[acetyl-CoA-carboxylase] ligase|nr:bifunctional biotin--[acetyl-CoA-carboxylase] ligase/biotin operon repressor BirA [Gammaproteobacteria bacterium]